MTSAIIAIGVVVAFWSLLATKLEQWRITAPMIVVTAGVVVGLSTRDTLAESLNTEVALRAAEIILAVLLFVDATEVKGGLLGSNPHMALRLLLIALPLSLGAALVAGWWLLPGLGWSVLLVIACVVMPIDFAPATAILRDSRLPTRVRTVLNVEGGYNDGIVSPIIIFALILAGDHTHTKTPAQALSAAGPSALKAIAVGVCLGIILAVLVNRAEHANLMSTQSKRLVLVAAPLLAYAIAVSVNGNGFVSSFVCGFVFHYLRRNTESRHDLSLLDDVGFLLTVAMWFVFGTAAVLALRNGIDLPTALYCLSALTIARILPVLLALIGSGVAPSEALLLGWLGPRGTTSIVFGLLAFNVLNDEIAARVLTVMVVTVLGSVVLHGGGSLLTARAYQRRTSTDPQSS